MHRLEVFPNRKAPLLFAHRGLHTKERENTIAAFTAAKEIDVDGIELDVHLTLDNALVVIHDFNTKRTTGIDAVVETKTLKELKEIDSEIPTLSEVFNAFGSSILYDIEIKCPLLKKSEIESVLWSTIKASGLKDNILVSSFDPFALNRFQHISKSTLPLAIIYDIDKGIPKIARKGAGRFLFRPSLLKPGLNAATHDLKKRHLPISVWCVDTQKEAEKYISMGARILISNRVDLLRETVQCMQQQRPHNE